MDGDSKFEIILCDDYYLYVFDAETRTLIFKSEILGDYLGWRGHLVAEDINQDELNEIVVGSFSVLNVFSQSFHDNFLPLIFH